MIGPTACSMWWAMVFPCVSALQQQSGHILKLMGVGSGPRRQGPCPCLLPPTKGPPAVMVGTAAQSVSANGACEHQTQPTHCSTNGRQNQHSLGGGRRARSAATARGCWQEFQRQHTRKRTSRNYGRTPRSVRDSRSAFAIGRQHRTAHQDHTPHMECLAQSPM